MRDLRIVLAAALAGLLVIAAAPVLAIDTIQSRDAPDLSGPRAKIKARDFRGAAVDLSAMIDRGLLHPDVYSLLGVSLRKSGDVARAGTFYAKALEFDPDHKGALEYQGEMFVELGRMPLARANLARLVRLCPTGCEEREDLEKALAAAPAP